jgi:hypothetical protein
MAETKINNPAVFRQFELKASDNAVGAKECTTVVYSNDINNRPDKFLTSKPSKKRINQQTAVQLGLLAGATYGLNKYYQHFMQGNPENLITRSYNFVKDGAGSAFRGIIELKTDVIGRIAGDNMAARYSTLVDNMLKFTNQNSSKIMQSLKALPTPIKALAVLGTGYVLMNRSYKSGKADGVSDAVKADELIKTAEKCGLIDEPNC